MSDVRIEARVVVREILDERTCLASLPNGKLILAYARKKDPAPRWRVGEERTVLLSLCDFSEGRLSQAAPPPPLPDGASTVS